MKNTKDSTIPFLPRDKDITNIQLLNDRINKLNECILTSNENIKELEKKAGNFYNKHFTIYGAITHAGFLSSGDMTDDNKKAILTIINNELTSKINYYKELIHSCEDELEWLEMKIGMSPNYGKTMFANLSFNFDITKDHV